MNKIFKMTLLQLFRHFQCIKGAAKSIVSWSNIKQITTILFEPKPVTFQDHLMTCLHNLNKVPLLLEIIHNTITLFIVISIYGPHHLL